jgi:hypothetical protein
MAKQSIPLQVTLLKLQSVFGTPESSLTGSDYVAPENPEITIDPQTTEVELVGGGFSNRLSVVGPYGAEVGMTFPLRTGGAADALGEYYNALQCCGWKGTEVTNVYTIAPTELQSEWKDCTVWGYSGNKDTSGSIVTKIGNVMFSPRFILDFAAGIARLEVKGRGMFSAVPAAGTIPSVARNTVAVPPLRGATISIMGDSDYEPLSFELDGGTTIESLIKASAASGKGASIIGDRKINWKAKVYRDLPATFDPITLWVGWTS